MPRWAWGVGAAAVLLAVVTGGAAGPAPDGPLGIGGKPVDFDGLHNVVRLSPKLYSGAAPEGDRGFAMLGKLGIRSIITVDGAPPDLERARKAGMRYVHIPFGYDGCPKPTADLIAKAVRDLPGPVYIHCHHGKHRSPTAAAFARIALDGIAPDQATAEMARAGTGKNYLGLYADVQAYRAPTAAALNRLRTPLRDKAITPPLVTAMVAIEQRFDRLMALQKNGWKVEVGFDAAYEALQLRELYTEIGRTAEHRKRPADYRAWMAAGEAAARTLEGDIRAGKLDDAGLSLGRVAAGCGSCHAKYRNIPQR